MWDRALIHKGGIFLWEELNHLPREVPESQRRRVGKGRQSVGIEICKDEKRKGDPEPFSLIHSLQLDTEEPVFSVFIQ